MAKSGAEEGKMNWIDCRGEWWSIIWEARKTCMRRSIERERWRSWKAPKGNSSNEIGQVESRKWNFIGARENQVKAKKKMCKLHIAELRGWRGKKYQWHSWANKMKINCEIIYLSVNWVELARAGKTNVYALFKHRFLPTDIIKSEILLIFISANWRFRINLKFSPRIHLARGWVAFKPHCTLHVLPYKCLTPALLAPKKPRQKIIKLQWVSLELHPRVVFD